MSDIHKDKKLKLVNKERFSCMEPVLCNLAKGNDDFSLKDTKSGRRSKKLLTECISGG